MSWFKASFGLLSEVIYRVLDIVHTKFIYFVSQKLTSEMDNDVELMEFMLAKEKGRI